MFEDDNDGYYTAEEYSDNDDIQDDPESRFVTYWMDYVVLVLEGNIEQVRNRSFWGKNPTVKCSRSKQMPLTDQITEIAPTRELPSNYI